MNQVHSTFSSFVLRPHLSCLPRCVGVFRCLKIVTASRVSQYKTRTFPKSPSSVCHPLFPLLRLRRCSGRCSGWCSGWCSLLSLLLLLLLLRLVGPGLPSLLLCLSSLLGLLSGLLGLSSGLLGLSLLLSILLSILLAVVILLAVLVLFPQVSNPEHTAHL